MTRLLMMEGNPAPLRERAQGLGIRSSSQIYAEALLADHPDLTIDTAYAADPGPWLAEGTSFADYDGIVVGGSSLHAYDGDFAVTNQIAMLAAACAARLPALGSCWGLQIATIAAGGQVARCTGGREIGIARKIGRTTAGVDHPLLAGKPPVFDAPCIHYDEVTRLPDGATLLAGNAHSAVQAAVVPIAAAEVWAVQYHPEFDLPHIADLLRLYAGDMRTQGFFGSEEDQRAYQDRLERLAAAPGDRALGWQLGIDGDILDDRIRRAELRAWIAHVRHRHRG